MRLVYAPPGSVGNYGGEVDNWMWPRHTGDFSFYRAYVGKDGKPAAFAADNVPYQPKHFLKLADQPLGEGDFVMVAGYPGSTSRYALASDFDATADWTYPTVGGHYKKLVALVEAAGKKNPDIAVKYASTVRGWQNAMKNYDGQLDGFQRIGAADTKQADEAAVLAWLRQAGQQGRGRAGRARPPGGSSARRPAPPANATWCSASCAAPARSARPRSCTACRSNAPSPTRSANRATSSATCRRSKAA